MAENKRQHYLPRFYLEGFSSEELFNGNKQNIIWYYDKDTRELKNKSIENIAWKPFYYSYKNESGEYDLSVEKYFKHLESETSQVLKKIEADAKILIKKITNKGITDNQNRKLSHDDKNTLLIFIFYMLKRVPEYIDYVEEGWKKEYDKLLIKHGKEFNQNEFKETIIDLVMEVGASGKMSFINLFNKKNIEFLYNNFSDSTIVTIDNPFIDINLDRDPGFVYEETNIFFPLSKRLIFRLYDFGSNIQIRKIDSKERLFTINCDIARRCYKYIFCRSEIYLRKILKEIRKHYIDF